MKKGWLLPTFPRASCRDRTNDLPDFTSGCSTAKMKKAPCLVLFFEPPVGIEPTTFPILHRDALPQK